MPSTGFTLVSAGANNADAGDDAWSNAGNVTASDNARASATSSKDDTTQYLHCTDPHNGSNWSAIDDFATIDGVEVRIERYATDNELADQTIQLIVGGTRQGDNNAGGNWPNGSGAEATADYGGATDTWGLTLTGTDVKASNFGVAIRGINNEGFGSDTFNVDAVWINVHYTPGFIDETLSPSSGVVLLVGGTPVADVLDPAVGDLDLFLSGGAANADPAASLGGAISTTPAGADLFDTVTSAEVGPGDVEYRCVYVKHTTGGVFADVGIEVKVPTPSSHTAIAIGKGTSAAGGTEQTVADEDTAPSSVTFSTSRVDLGSLSGGAWQAVWLRRTVDAGATATLSDSVTVELSILREP